MSWTPSKFWQLRSWDKLIIPKPFSTIQVAFGEPVSVLQEQKLPSSIEVKSIEEKINEIDQESSLGVGSPH